MPMVASTTTAASASPTTPTIAALFLRRPPPIPAFFPIRAARHFLPRSAVSCQVASIDTDVSSSASSSSTEEPEELSRVGSRIRVKVPVRIYHVAKAPELDLCGMEGVIKQYVGFWKGKRISANLPFKVEFFVPIDGQENPVKVLAHLQENEFEYLSDSNE